MCFQGTCHVLYARNIAVLQPSSPTITLSLDFVNCTGLYVPTSLLYLTTEVGTKVP